MVRNIREIHAETSERNAALFRQTAIGKDFFLSLTKHSDGDRMKSTEVDIATTSSETGCEPSAIFSLFKAV